jgi:hypothetical protein
MGGTTRLSPATVVTQHREQTSAEIDGQVVVMGFVQGKYVGLSRSASEVWRRLAQPAPIGALCDALVRDFEGDPIVIRNDVLDLLDRLDDLGLLEVSPPVGHA